MNKIIGLSLLICIGAVGIDACKKKPQPKCSYSVCSSQSYKGYPNQDFSKLAPNSCVTQTNPVNHQYRTVTLNQNSCPGRQYCSTRDQHRTKCRCQIITMKNTQWSEWHKMVTDDGSCKMKRVMNRQYKISYPIRDNRCLNHEVPNPKIESKDC